MAQVATIDHETGDLSQYTTTVDPDVGELNVTNAAAMGGLWGMAATMDDADSLYGRLVFAAIATGIYRLRFYFDPNGLDYGDWEDFRIFQLHRDAALRLLVYIRWRDGTNTFYISVDVIDDNGAYIGTNWYTITDDAHYIEILVEYADDPGSENGELTLWVDGALQENINDIDIFTRTQPNEMRMGAVGGVDAGCDGTIYLDEFIIRDDAVEIGPYVPTERLPRNPVTVFQIPAIV